MTGPTARGAAPELDRLDVPEAEPCALGAARAVLAGLAERPLAEHPASYADVHDRLQSALAALDHL